MREPTIENVSACGGKSASVAVTVSTLVGAKS